jgi:hypothetical protein
MSDNTVRTHVAAIFDILGVRNRTEAAMPGRPCFDCALFSRESLPRRRCCCTGAV